MSVQFFKSTDTGAPALSGTVGTLVAVLDACLVNGYNSQTLTSITRSGSTATATKTAHGFRDGARVLIAGADQPEYNGEFPITLVDANTFTFPVTGTPATPATGASITAKVNGAGWTKPFSATNKAVYRNSPTTGTGFYLNLQDTGPGAGGAREVRVWGYETATAQDTGTGQFPTTAQAATGLFWRKSSTADATARAWFVIADETCFYLGIETGDVAGTAALFSFGDIFSYKANDTYRCAVIGHTTENATAAGNGLFCDLGLAGAVGAGGVSGGHYLARTSTGVGSAVQFGKHTDVAKHNIGAMGAVTSGALSQTIAYPNPHDNGLILAPVYVHHSAGVRGYLKGVWNPCHHQPLGHGDVVNGNAGAMSGKQFLMLQAYNFASTTVQSRVAFEISNTWS